MSIMGKASLSVRAWLIAALTVTAIAVMRLTIIEVLAAVAIAIGARFLIAALVIPLPGYDTLLALAAAVGLCLAAWAFVAILIEARFTGESMRHTLVYLDTVHYFAHAKTAVATILLFAASFESRARLRA